jgi:hypothetical protein
MPTSLDSLFTSYAPRGVAPDVAANHDTRPVATTDALVGVMDALTLPPTPDQRRLALAALSEATVTYLLNQPNWREAIAIHPQLRAVLPALSMQAVEQEFPQESDVPGFATSLTAAQTHRVMLWVVDHLPEALRLTASQPGQVPGSPGTATHDQSPMPRSASRQACCAQVSTRLGKLGNGAKHVAELGLSWGAGAGTAGVVSVAGPALGFGGLPLIVVGAVSALAAKEGAGWAWRRHAEPPKVALPPHIPALYTSFMFNDELELAIRAVNKAPPRRLEPAFVAQWLRTSLAARHAGPGAAPSHEDMRRNTLEQLDIRHSMRTDPRCAAAAADVVQWAIDDLCDTRPGVWNALVMLLLNLDGKVLDHLYLEREHIDKLQVAGAQNGKTDAYLKKGTDQMVRANGGRAIYNEHAAVNEPQGQGWGWQWANACAILARNANRFERFTESDMAKDPDNDGKPLWVLVPKFELSANLAEGVLDEGVQLALGVDETGLPVLMWDGLGESPRAGLDGPGAPEIKRRQPEQAPAAQADPHADPQPATLTQAGKRAIKQAEKDARTQALRHARRNKLEPPPRATPQQAARAALQPAARAEPAAPQEQAWRREGVAAKREGAHHRYRNQRDVANRLKDLFDVRPGRQWRHVDAVNRERERRHKSLGV